jgi:hypothetical protein
VTTEMERRSGTCNTESMFYKKPPKLLDDVNFVKATLIVLSCVAPCQVT